MELVKNHIDVGLYTNDLEPMLAFWQQEIGLAFDHLGKLGGGVHQHRHHMAGSILKINHARDPLPQASQSGYRELVIARAGLAGTQELHDPDGNRVRLVAPGADGVEGIAVVLAVRDAAQFHAFYGRVLGLPEAGANAYRCGDSLLRFEQDPAVVRAGAQKDRGYRYITLQIRDCDSEHAQATARGAESGREPLTLGTTVRFSFIRDPDGNWIELSERFELSGTGPDKSH